MGGESRRSHKGVAEVRVGKWRAVAKLGMGLSGHGNNRMSLVSRRPKKKKEGRREEKREREEYLDLEEASHLFWWLLVVHCFSPMHPAPRAMEETFVRIFAFLFCPRRRVIKTLYNHKLWLGLAWLEIEPRPSWAALHQLDNMDSIRTNPVSHT